MTKPTLAAPSVLAGCVACLLTFLVYTLGTRPASSLPPPDPCVTAASTHDSLDAALAAIGTAPADLVVQSNKTWNITAHTTIPANVSVEVRKGGMFDISAGVTLTIAGRLTAGNYRVFAGTGSVDLAQGEVNVVWFTSQGDGKQGAWTGENGQGGIGEAILRTVRAHTYLLPPGIYSVFNTITVRKHGSIIQGQDIRYVSGRAYSVPGIWYTNDTPSPLFDFDLGRDGEMLRDCALRGINFASNDPGGSGHTIVRATNTSNFEASYLDTHIFRGTGIDYRGKENGLIKKVVLDFMHSPIVLNKNPRSSDGVDIDTLTIQDSNLSCDTSRGTDAAQITLADGLVFNDISTFGQQGWQTCFHGVYWNDTSSTRRSGTLAFSNQKFEQCFVSGVRCEEQDQYASYSYYIRANAGLDQLIVKHFSSGGREAGLVFAKNVKAVSMGPGSYVCFTPPTSLKPCYLLNAEDVGIATIDGTLTGAGPQIRTPGMTQVHEVTGTYEEERNFRRVFVRQ